MLARIIAEIDVLAGFTPIAEEEAKNEHAEARWVRHRQRPPELAPPPKRLSYAGRTVYLPSVAGSPAH